MKKFLRKIITKTRLGYKAIIPHMSLIAVLLCVVNLIFLINIKKEVHKTNNTVDIIYGEVYDIEDKVNNISEDYDNSDVLNMIQNHHKKVIDKIESEASSIESTVRIWSN